MKALLFDTETTDVIDPRIIEVAWMELESPNNHFPGPTFHKRYNPMKPISLGALATHHIMDEELANEDPYSSFFLPEGTAYIIGHNIDFDWKAIGSPDVKRICTLALSRWLLPHLDSHTQSAMAYHFFRPQARGLLKGAHSADGDVLVLKIILQHLLQLMQPEQYATWDALWETSEKARVPVYFTFGKHKGEKIADAPYSYKQWMLKQPELCPYLVKALRGEAA